MVIQYFGMGMVKASVGDKVIAFAPIGKKGDIEGSSFGADICLVPIKDDNYNGSDRMGYGAKEALVFDSPGEYEAGGVFIKGIASVGPDNKTNTIYTVQFDDMRLCHLGALASADISSEMYERIGEVDILFVPTYDSGVLSESLAAKVATSIAPAIVVPLYYGGKGKDSLSKFLKESGESDQKPVDKLTLRIKDLEGKEGDIVPIKSF